MILYGPTGSHGRMLRKELKFFHTLEEAARYQIKNYRCRPDCYDLSGDEPICMTSALQELTCKLKEEHETQES